ncbi:hypothetical protein BGX38DRAFT_1138452 [Terfezia claveryi]|nr:hypothetical protein BGX38DRAFT_1138452 [Terfezia claveryi]
MFNKSTFFAALFVLLGFTLRFSNATPPACVLTCVNERREVYNYEDVCKTGVADVAACLKKECSSVMYDDAITSYKASCEKANYDVVIPTAIPSSTSAKTTGSSSTRTGSSTPTDTSTSTSTSTSSNSSATGKAQNENSASTVYYNSILALIAVFATAVAL